MTNKNFTLNAERVRLWIKKNGLKQNHVAERLGVTPSKLSLMLTTGKIPRQYDLIRRLSQITKIKRMELLVPRKPEA